MYEVDCFNLSASCQDKSIKGKKLGLQICPPCPGTGPSFPSASGERETLVILVTRGAWPVITPPAPSSHLTGCQLRVRILCGKIDIFSLLKFADGN